MEAPQLHQIAQMPMGSSPFEIKTKVKVLVRIKDLEEDERG
jgi:hypothetical protein